MGDQNRWQLSGGIRRTHQVATDAPIAFWRLHRCSFSLDAAVVFRDLDRPSVIRPEHLEQRRRGHTSDSELLRASEEFAPGNFPMHVKIEQVQKLLREIGCLLSFHRSAPCERPWAGTLEKFPSLRTSVHCDHWPGVYDCRQKGPPCPDYSRTTSRS